ncbi:DTX3L [Branchiostoma lanceolatum]|nr:DTX3L [Branchiostoma lanceolatum]
MSGYEGSYWLTKPRDLVTKTTKSASQLPGLYIFGRQVDILGKLSSQVEGNTKNFCGHQRLVKKGVSRQDINLAVFKRGVCDNMDDVTGEGGRRMDKDSTKRARRDDDAGAGERSVDADRRSILVSNIPEGINRDKLEIHFMRKSNGGGDIETVTLLGSSKAKITFLDESFIQSVLDMEQVVMGKKVEVQRCQCKSDDAAKPPLGSEKQKDSYERIQVFDRVRAFVGPKKSHYITKSWMNTVKKGKDLGSVEFKKGEERNGMEIGGEWATITKVRSLLQIQVKVSQGQNARTDSHGVSGSRVVDTASAGTEQGRGGVCSNTPSEQPGGESAAAVRPKRSPHVTNNHGTGTPGRLKEVVGPTTRQPKPTVPQTHVDKETMSGQLPHTDDGLDGGPDASTASHSFPHKQEDRSTQTSKDDPFKIVIAPDIVSYLMQVNGRKVLNIIMKNKAVIVMNNVTEQTEVEFFGSDAAGSDPNNALEEFTTLYQQTHHGIVCKTLELQSIPPDDISKAVAKITEDYPRVMPKISADKVVMFYGTEKEAQDAKTAMCDHLGISTGRGRRRRGAAETTGVPNRPAATGKGSSSTTPWFDHTTREGIQIVVAHGDITQQQVDAIANAANESLDHGGGVAGAISKAGGPSVQKESKDHVRRHGRVRVSETAVTSGGKLPCEYIIHAVGPKWERGHEEMNERQLRKTCFNILTKASATLRAQSVAIPAISSGIFGMPKQKCADALLLGLQQFLKRAKSSSCTLRKIIFIDMDQETVKILADTFNNKVPSSASPSTADTSASSDGGVSRPPSDQYSQTIEDSTASRKSHTDQGGTGKGLKSDGDDAAGDCSICMSVITDPKSLPCKHTFCRACIDTALSYKSQCPMCNTIVGELKGDQPPGSMTWYTSYSTRLPGYEDFGAIVISYSFWSGTQGPDHPNPGRYFSGTSRTAYLPNNDEGRELVQLLKRAFDNRLVFTIGTSVTTGATDTVIWNDIHHKTNIRGGSSR